MNTTETKSPRYLTCAETAKEVRKALKAAFPGIKFSVRSNNYSGGASIDVKWFDGPTSKAVDKVANKFAGATFDGMIDLKSYHDSELNGEPVRFGADFIFTKRALSVSFLTNIATQYCKRYHEEMPEIKTWDYDNSAHIDQHPCDYWHPSNQIMRKANETDEKDLDKLFTKEDAELAEAEQWRSARKAEKAAEIEESPVVEQEEVVEVSEVTNEEQKEEPVAIQEQCPEVKKQMTPYEYGQETGRLQAIRDREISMERIRYTGAYLCFIGDDLDKFCEGFLNGLAEETIEAAEPTKAQEEQEKYIDPRSDPDAPNVYRFDPVSRIHWLEFSEKPDEETRKLLKDEGWRWSSYRQQWHTNRRWAKVPDGIPYRNDGSCDYSAERADRLEARAMKASERGKAAYNKAHHIGSFIPMGQPILIGHHSERRHRRDLERIDNNMRTFVNESDKAKKLEDKAADSISHRAYLERPGVIDRRIKRLEATLRRLERQKEHWSDKAEYSRRVALLTQEINENKAKLESFKEKR
jgi:hypothetical protein